MRISNRLDKHIVAAAAVAAGVTASVNAGVIYSGVVNFVCAVDIDGTYINVETGVLSNGPGSGVPGWDVNPYRSGTGSGMNFFSATGGGYMRAPGDTVGVAGNLAIGTLISGAASFSTSTAGVTFGASAGQWQYGAENIIGFRFVSSAGTTHYGWMRFLMGAQPTTGNLVSRTVVDFAYESIAGAAIDAGAIPAPGAIALLGLAGFAGRRRR